MENKAYTYLFNDILGKVLELSENPSHFAEYLSQQIRELVGARTVIIAIRTEAGHPKIFSVFPDRRSAWASQNDIFLLADLSFDFETIQYLDCKTSEENTTKMLQRLEIDKVLAIPLIAANRKVGSLLLLDIMDIFGMESVMDLMARLSGVFALVIRNSYIFQNLESLVATRTVELQKQNSELLRREQELQAANEEFESLNEELTENIRKTKEINAQLVEANQRTRQSEMQSRDILQTAMDGFWKVDLQGRFIDVNEIACKMLGYSREEMLNMSISDIENEETFEDVLSHIKKIFEVGEDLFESKHRCKDGKIIDVEISAKFQHAQNMNVVFIRNITGHKQAEKIILDREKQLRFITDNVPILIAQCDFNRKYKFVNIPYSELFGLKPSDIIGKHISEILNKDSYIEASPYMDFVLAGHETSYEMAIPSEAHGSIVVSVNYVPEYDSSGKVVGFIAAIIDISQRKKAEDALAEEKQTLANIIKGTNSGTWDWNITTGALILNERWAEIIGYSLEELQPVNISTWSKKVHPDDLAVANALMDRHTNHELDYYDVEFRMRHKNGNWIWVQARGKVVEWTEDGKPVIISGTHLDISERKRAEQELIDAKEHAEESDRLKSAFLANMSHEIRTPMNGILGFAELLKEPELTGKQQQEYIRVIEKSGARMLNIINDIVDISKIESGQMNLTVSETNVNEQMDYLLKFFKTEAANKGIQLVNKSTLSVKEATISSDREKLYAILTNLIKNAIKFTDSGLIEFGCCRVETLHATSLPQEHLQFYVKDTGAGIPKKRQEAIFERFIQAEIVDKMARQGAGLGLAISKAYVEMLGGKIWVESEFGKGSTFYFTLPDQTVDKLANEKENIILNKRKEFKMRMLKMLIVEDDESSSRLISIVMSKYGDEIINVRTGNEAVEACRSHPDLDLILMDIQIPELDGYEATRIIRQFNKSIVIIAQTAFALAGDRELAIEAGCTDYISKPIKRDELTTIIQKHFK